ncbi:LLM class flavin-dependent oxidoreductase [Streptomyces natalensis]|uniref:Oxidoreductase n=1 Tax=Streptomyces natalensis ATCC 27448 TaxID=1240678 RepID=A0A0D7CK57_9ACTN|nr:LLM class flavin-dependent oxidoreductase [Streptomyces natalensis]KIZ16619.1 oxidoreductase [Streptomyces natalensis ATCC 27448]
MEFGVSLLPDTGPEERSGRDYYADLLAVSRLADQLGLDYVKMTEHYLRPYGGYCPSPLIFLSAVASVTNRIRLMTGGIQASFHHPIQLAAQTSQLDAISDGRLDVGFARAFLPYEFEAFGVDLDSSTERFRETVRAVLRLWTEQKVSEDNPFFRYTDVTSFPAPTQEPHPPTWAAALFTKSSFEWIGDMGINLLMSAPPRREDMAHTQKMINHYRDHFARAVGSTTERHSKVAISIPLLIAESDDEAGRLGRRLLRKHWARFSEAAASWHNVSSPAYQGYQEAVQKKYGNDVSDTELDSTAFFGSPESVVDKVREVRKTLAPDVILWQVDFGQQPLKVMERTLKLFADQVRPHL